jgi:acetoin utilization deacetylase AcuC-like enzyme
LRSVSTAITLLDAVLAASKTRSADASGTGDSISSTSTAALVARSGLSLCRPPGHHATAGDQMGFCLLNSAALAARHAQRAHGLQKASVGDGCDIVCVSK